MKYLTILVTALLLGCDGSVGINNPTDVPDEPTTPQPSTPENTPEPEDGPEDVPLPVPVPAPAPAPIPVTPLEPGERANWLRGSWGINWKPVDLYNGRGETITADKFLQQISQFKTIDFLQLHLGDSYTSSPVHMGPHDLLESLRQGDIGTDGKPLNLVVPRAAADIDPFFDMLKATKAAGLKTMVYVNSSNMLEREDETNPAWIPNITQRWKTFCDTDAQVQAFLDTESFHRDEDYPDRHYMFCYTEFVLKDYSIRYGDLIDAWLFDSGDHMVLNGDNATSGLEEDQKIFEAFSNAARAGNPNVAVSFNNGPERETEALNPFSEAVLHEDYMFGHPYNGGRVIGNHENGLYDRNYAHIQKITETGGNIHAGGQWTWDDKIVGHFDPPMSTTSWKGGSTPALTDEEFMLWNLESAQGGGAISWGAPLIKATGELDQLLIQDWGMAQLTLMDDHLSINQSPGAPNWARAETALVDAAFGQDYLHTLVESVDFWDPETDEVSLSIVDAGTGTPAWLTINADPANPGTWLLSGVPTETSAVAYNFTLRAQDASGFSDRSVHLTVGAIVSPYPHEASVKILATANTAYGIDTVATMTSDILTAPDQLATFQIAFDVTPQSGQQIVSATITDATTAQSWGINDAIFRGSDGESVESMDNIRVVNFNANGGNLTIDDIQEFSFDYALIADGQSAGDRILVDVDGILNTDGGTSLVSNPDTINLRILGYVPVTTLKLGVGTDLTTNKWAVNSINVLYVINNPEAND